MNKSFKEDKKICVLGLGYIGLPLAVFLAEQGYSVVGIDIDTEKISHLKNGELITDETGFFEHYKVAWESGRLKFQNYPESSEVFVIAVQTPLNSELHKADLSYVNKALQSILPYLSPSNLIILESTVPPFTCRKIIKQMIESETHFQVPEDIHVVHCPERAYPGNLVYEMINNHRIIGGISSSSAEKAYDIYKSFVKGSIFLTDDVTAEVVKLAENTYRDINIAYANELRLVCDSIGADHKEIIQLANHHPRVQILQSGIGVGGHCIPIDPWFLREIKPELSRLLPIAREINDTMPEYIAKKIIRLIPSGVSNPKVVIVGKTYKPNVRDTRESPALKIIRMVKQKQKEAEIRAVDPCIDNVSVSEIDLMATSSDLLVILVPHEKVIQYIKKNKDIILKKMRTPNIVFADEL